MSYIDLLISERLGGRSFDQAKGVYKFTKIHQARAEAIARHPGVPVINLGVGEPDIPADSGVVRVLAEEAGKTENKGYPNNGIAEFHEAAAEYLKQVYGLKNIDPKTDVMHGIGSKAVITMMPLCFINPGDVTLATFPRYPVIATHTQYLGGEVYDLPLYKKNEFYPDFNAIPKDILKRAKLLYINYPNNPTGQTATEDFYKEVVEFAYKNKIIVVSDAAYAAITFDGQKPLSFLSVDGAKEVGIEIHSLSKAFNMAGWRLGFAAGNPKIIEIYTRIKDNTDSGQFIAIQKAAAYALKHPEITERNSERYSRRFDLLIPALKRVGFSVKKPKGSFFCYAEAPKGAGRGVRFENAGEAAEYIIKNALISTVPWDEAGAYLRISVTFEANGIEEEKQMVEEVERRLQKLELVF